MSYIEILTTFQQILDRRFLEAKVRSTLSGDDVPLKSIQELFFYAKFDIRFYALASSGQMEEIWDYVRGDEHKLDFVMGLRSELFTRLTDAGNDKAVNLVGLLTLGHSLSQTVDYRESVIDTDTLERLPESDWLKKTLQANDWLVVLYLTHQAEMPKEFVK